MKTHPRIVFYGTPVIAVASLQRLVEEGYPVAGVVTAPDRPSGRGLKIRFSPVKEFAIRHDLQLLQPANLKDPQFLLQLRALGPELQVVVAFRMLPKEVWALPPLGTFNLHASLLPQYRGAAPINRVLMNGEEETGLTTFFIEEAIDTGNLLFSEATCIQPEETAGELHDRLMVMGADLVLKTTRAIESGTALASPQSESISSWSLPLKAAPKLRKEECRITWDREVQTLFNFIRGLSPYPGAFTDLTAPDGANFTLKIFKADIEIQPVSLKPGTVLSDGMTYLKVVARDGCIVLKEIQPAGRKTMDSLAFLKGYGKHFV